MPIPASAVLRRIAHLHRRRRRRSYLDKENRWQWKSWEISAINKSGCGCSISSVDFSSIACLPFWVDTLASLFAGMVSDFDSLVDQVS